MPYDIVYQETEDVLVIRFTGADLDLRQVGIVATTLHQAINAVVVNACAPKIADSVRFASRRGFDDPLFVSLRIEELHQGSLFASCKLRVSRPLLRNLAVGTTASLLATAIWVIGSAAYRQLGNEPPPPPTDLVMPPQTPEVAPSVREMVEGLSKTSRPWELTLRDKRTGYEITVKSK